MERLRNITLADEDGNPVDDRVAATLRRLEPKLRREFPNIQDDVAASLVARAASKVARHVRESKPLAKPFGFAWRVLRNLAISTLRGPSIELHRTRVVGGDGHDAVSQLRALDHSASQIETSLFLEEVKAYMTDAERVVYILKLAGYTSEEIAAQRGSSVGSVDVVFSRVKKKLRKLAGIPE